MNPDHSKHADSIITLAAHFMRDLTEEERVDFMESLTGIYCQRCGFKHPSWPKRCECERDE